MKKRSQDVMGPPIEQRAEMAFKAVVAKALSEHARLGVPAQPKDRFFPSSSSHGWDREYMLWDLTGE